MSLTRGKRSRGGTKVRASKGRKESKDRKEKKSYTLSPESVAFLEAIRKQRRSLSVSAVLDEILRSLRNAEKKAALDRAVTSYYDSVTGGERDEHRAWGDLAILGFAKQDG